LEKDNEILISGRYRIVKKIASGGMADIYLGDDLELKRKVAVKVLSANYAGDRNFVARFRREAQVLAGLNHPNIVDIYDWGKFNSSYYIVMEYIEGISLKELIERKGFIKPDTAADYAMQICDALGAAHDNNLIHRDIKPQNILISRDGKIKVTDFGIAKSLNTDITKTLNIVGTAHYISPEQARGDILDNRTDIYSLGIVLYEMLTGDLPFRGDTSIDISLKHISENPVKPTRLIQDIPKKLEKIVMMCLKKDRTQRYPGIMDLKLDLNYYLKKKPLLLGKRGRDFIRNRTIPDGLKKNAGVLITSIIAVVFLGLFVAYSILYYQKEPAVEVETRVPPLENTHIDTAEDILSQLGLNIVITGERESDRIPADYIIEHDPSANSIIEKDDIIEVIISSGRSQAQITAPNLLGLTEDQARQYLEELGLNLGSSQNEFSEQFDAGEIIRQSPLHGSGISIGESVNITVSKGQEKILVPNIIGVDFNYAIRHLDSLGLKVISNIVPLDSQVTQPGIVVSVNPKPGTAITSQDIVEISISASGYFSEVPSVTGLNVSEAILELQALSIIYEIIYVEADYSIQKDEVLQQWPDEGLYLPAGSPVLLFVGK
jgi:serine/threonine-protein kinase